jgi:hypothetical protein
MIQPKNYLRMEGARNRINAAIFERLVKLAFGSGNSVITGHHINFEYNGDIATENEIPSADTLIFDHDVMTEVFGADAINVMQSLARTRAENREILLAHYLGQLSLIDEPLQGAAQP